MISDVGGTSKNQSARNMADCALAFLSLNEQEFSSIQVNHEEIHCSYSAGF